MNITAPSMADTDIGRGYDFFTGNLLFSPFDSASLPKLQPVSSGPKINFFASLVEDTSEVSKMLDISAQADFGVGAFKGSASASFSREIRLNSYNLFMIGCVDVDLGKAAYSATELARLRLADTVVQRLEAKETVSAFRAAYGDQFVSGYVLGGRLDLVIEIEANSSEDKKRAVASINASGVSWSAHAAFKSTVETLAKGRRVTAKIYQQGADWANKSIDADSLFQALMDFPVKIQAHPVVRSFETTAFDGVQNWPAGAPTPSYLPAQMAGTVSQFQKWV